MMPKSKQINFLFILSLLCSLSLFAANTKKRSTKSKRPQNLGRVTNKGKQSNSAYCGPCVRKTNSLTKNTQVQRQQLKGTGKRTKQ